MRHILRHLPSTSSASSSSSKSKSPSSSSSSNEAADGRPGPRAKSLLLELVADVRTKNDKRGDCAACVWCCTTCKSCADWCCMDLWLCTTALGANARSRVGIVKAATINNGVDANDKRRCCECCCLCLFILLLLCLVKKRMLLCLLKWWTVNRNYGTNIGVGQALSHGGRRHWCAGSECWWMWCFLWVLLCVMIDGKDGRRLK